MVPDHRRAAIRLLPLPLLPLLPLELLLLQAVRAVGGDWVDPAGQVAGQAAEVQRQLAVPPDVELGLPAPRPGILVDPLAAPVLPGQVTWLLQASGSQYKQTNKIK